MDTKTIIAYLKYKDNESWGGRELLRKGGLLLWAGHDITQFIGFNDPDWDEIVVSEYSEENTYIKALKRLEEATVLNYYKMLLVTPFPQSLLDQMNNMLKTRKKKKIDTTPPTELFPEERWEAAKKAGTDHVIPSPKQIEQIYQREKNTPVVMLNYMKYRDIAIYPDDFKGKRIRNGRRAYMEYGQRGQQQGQLDIGGIVKSTIVGDNEPNWENFVFVRYSSLNSFIGMISSEHYRESSIHRSAGLEDTILLAITPYDEPY